MTFKLARSNPEILLSHKFKNTSNNLRIAIAISKKVSKKSVNRNKIRRIIQEWIITNIQKINNHKPYWLLVNLKIGDFCNDKNKLLEEFQNLMFKSRLIKWLTWKKKLFYEGGPAKSDLIINLLAGITILGLPFTFAAIVRALWLRYKITNKRITIDGGWFGKNKTQVSLNNIDEIKSIPRGFGSYGDMVLILNDGSKVEMKSLPLFREKQKFIEENIISRSQTPNLNEVKGFATKS